jgi:D-alanyl-D-alanine carboxypeptidase
VDKHFCKLKTLEVDEKEVPFKTEGQKYVKFILNWQNSNKLLTLPGFCGVKTGITSTAGSCLAVYYNNPKLNRNLITVVLGSRNVEYRWKDTRRLTLYANEVLLE